MLHVLFLLESPFPISSADWLLFSLQLKHLGPWIFPEGSLQISYVNFLTAWWLDFKSEDLKRTGWKMHCL